MRCCLVSFAAVSFAVSFAIAKPGFYSATSNEAPKSIAAASQFVFEFWGSGNIQKLDRSRYLELAKKLSTTKPTSFRQKMAFAVARAEIARCDKLALRTCSVSSEPARGSAFFVEGGQLVTVSHNFALESALIPFFADLQENWNEQLAKNDTKSTAIAIEKINAFSTEPMAEAIFFVTDRGQNVVLSSLTRKYQFVNWRGSVSPKVTVETACAPGGDNCNVKQIVFDSQSTAKPTSLFSDHRSLLDDVAILSHGSRSGIPLADTPCKAGEKTYILGYPAKTSNRKKNGFRDAADRELVFTDGISIEVKKLDQLSDWSGIGKLVTFFDGKNVMFSDADGWPGMSGGVILNRDGKVCGVYVGSSPMGGQLEMNKQSGRYNLFSIGVPLAK